MSGAESRSRDPNIIEIGVMLAECNSLCLTVCISCYILDLVIQISCNPKLETTRLESTSQ